MAAQVPGPASEEEFAEVMKSLGATSLPSIELRYDRTTSIDIELHRLEHNVFGRSDTMSQDVIRGVAARTRAWAADRFGSLDEPIVWTRTLTYHVFRGESR
jgi:hypothetical protein